MVFLNNKYPFMIDKTVVMTCFVINNLEYKLKN